MTRIRRRAALVFALLALAGSLAPAALADAGGRPGNNTGCRAISHRHRPAEAVTTSNPAHRDPAPSSLSQARGFRLAI
jgi:hypothetical protein